ncbi:carboxypeptidase S [Armillaria gallica]|uniref:Carboxypeptidase S n=1 Tax=Armillaria gallica TaxID=47427 RepID=A0A2H3ED62_ARMGA|nr:carboxypeptidase S [Armillaria gallica]
MSEKNAVPWVPRRSSWNLGALLGAVIIGWGSYTMLYKALDAMEPDLSELDLTVVAPNETSVGCPQISPLFPKAHSDIDATLDSLYRSDTFKLKAYELLGGAVRVPTESYDDLLPVGYDERWDVFSELHECLERSFPRVYDTLHVAKINTYGLILHWQGSQDHLKPILITAHQDVVPVDPTTVEQWTHPPYSGHFDGTWIWGRGCADDKADLISQLIAVEQLLAAGFKPQRTVVFALGIDEEASGTEGAGKLAVYLESTYGVDGFAMLVDEGEGYDQNVKDAVIFAFPGVSEKGYFDAQIEVFTPGGHSSVPPAHTSIGILSLMIVEIEKNAFQPEFLRSGTGFANAQCAATYDPKFTPSLRALARKALTDDQALEDFKRALIALNPIVDVMLKTTQAVDLIQGGVKVNALPEKASAVINHRVAEHSSTEEVQQHIIELLTPVAAEYNLSVDAFGKTLDIGGVEGGRMVLSDAFGSALQPSPVSPLDLKGPYGMLSGTIKATLQSSDRYEASGVVVMPSLGLGNTDTQFYWNLTRHIFRYSHRGNSDDLYNGLHTVNEAIRGESVIEQIRFFTKLILNSDEADF